MEATLHNQEGKEVGKITLPEKLFGASWNADLVHQATVTMAANARTPVAHAKDRSQVSGGGKKPWKQKGTGRARHGSSRSPIWVGGGVSHGPKKEKIFARKLNKKMRSKALSVMLSKKFKDGEILFLDSITLKENKTKTAAKVLAGLGKKEFSYKKGNRALLALPSRNASIERSFRNIPIAEIDEVRNLNPLSLMSYKYLVMVDAKKCIEALEKRVA